MKIETRNRKIVEMYLTGDFTLRKIGKIVNLSDGRVRQIIVLTVGIEKFKDVKRMRAERVAERMKENYLAGIQYESNCPNI
jgi:DNA-directed RNA polymerase sigma subunit (sigma70/sigma32)